MAKFQIYNYEVPIVAIYNTVMEIYAPIGDFVERYDANFIATKQYEYDIDDLTFNGIVYDKIQYISTDIEIKVRLVDKETHSVVYDLFTISKPGFNFYSTILPYPTSIKLKENKYENAELAAIFLWTFEYIVKYYINNEEPLIKVEQEEDAYHNQLNKITILNLNEGFDVFVKCSYNSVKSNGNIPLISSYASMVNKILYIDYYANFLCDAASTGIVNDNAYFIHVGIDTKYAPPLFNIKENVNSSGFRYINIEYLEEYFYTFNIFSKKNNNNWIDEGEYKMSKDFIYIIEDNVNKYYIQLVQYTNNDLYPKAPYLSAYQSIDITKISPQLEYKVNEEFGTIDVHCLGGLTIGLNKMTGAGWALVEQKDLNERNYCTFDIRESGKYQVFTIKTKPAYLSESSEEIDIDVDLDIPITTLILGETQYYGRDYENVNIVRTFDNKLRIMEVKNATAYKIYKDGELYEVITNDNNITSAFSTAVFKKITKK